MGLRLFADANAYAEALAASSGGLSSICNRERLDPAQVLHLQRFAADRGHRELLGDADLRAGAQRDVDAFFRAAARCDPQRVFAYSSKVILSVTDYQDLQKAFLLRSAFAAAPDAPVLLLVPDARLRQLFAELFNDAPARRAAALPGMRAWGRFARTALRAVANRARHAHARILMFTLSGDTPRAGDDVYFGSFASELRARASTLTVYLASGPRLNLRSDAHSAPFEAFISAAAVVRTWLSAFASGPAASARGLGNEALAPLHRYIREAEVRAGTYFMQRLLARGFRCMLERVSPEVLVYPFENRSWERALLAAAKAHGVLRRIAYQHSSITPRHLAFHVAADEPRPEHLPDRVVTIGEHTAALLRRLAPVLGDRIVIGSSLRSSRQPVSDAGAPAVLVAISSSRSEALSLLQATHEASSRVDVPFIVRTHPTIPVDDLFALFQWPPNVELSRGRSLADDLTRVTMVAFSSSTVALEGMLYGRLPVFVDIGDVPAGDPIMGEHPFKFVAAGGAALAAEIERIGTLDAARLETLRAAARVFAEGYLSAPTTDAVERMADAVLQP